MNVAVKFCFVIFLLLLVTHCPGKKQCYFKLSIAHINDFHARFEETSLTSGNCKDDKCIGGFARVVTMYKRTRNQPNYVFLNAGDNFQGTLWYNLFKWNVTAHFMNKLPFNAYTLGNHEFDDNIKGVVPFIKSLNAPVVVSNINDTLEPTIQGTYKKSIVIRKGGRKIGIIGVILKTTNIISSTGKLSFLDEVESVNKEAERLVKKEKVFTNIVLSHCGYEVEKNIAKNSKNKISVVVGAHSHSLLYTGTPPSGGTPEGPYPTVEKNEKGENVLVLQAAAYTKYFGNIQILYDIYGRAIKWSGQPIYLGTNITQDPKILQELEPWKNSLVGIGKEVLGETLVPLSTQGCFTGECNIGNFFTDAMVAAWRDGRGEKVEDGAWTYVSLAITNAGGLRTTIPKGTITYSDVISAQPFGNTLDCGEIQGKYIKEAFEFSTKPYDNKKSFSDIYIPQISGMKIVYDLTQPYGSRVTSLKVKCQNCPTPVFEDIKPEQVYRIVLISFLRGGGDGFTALSNNIKNVKIGPVDIDFYREYIPKVSPINTQNEGRITVLGGDKVTAKIVK